MYNRTNRTAKVETIHYQGSGRVVGHKNGFIDGRGALIESEPPPPKSGPLFTGAENLLMAKRAPLGHPLNLILMVPRQARN